MRIALLVAFLVACTPRAPTWVPLAATAAPAELTLVWVGTGTCERFEGGAWVRCPELDYEFSVEQRRGATQWSSVKSLRRRHPSYDGSAGPRAQTYFFELSLARDADGVATQLESSLGRGHGRADAEFRTAELEIAAATSRFAPFDRYVITQRYLYEQGRLEELVELRDGSSPWVRNREVAQLYAVRAFTAPPTRM